MDDFDKYLESSVFPLLKTINDKRKQKIAVFFSIVAVVFFTDIIILKQLYIDFYLIFVVFFSIIICIVAYKQIFKSYSLDFAKIAIAKIVKYIDNNLEYSQASNITKEEYASSKLYSTDYDGFEGQDLIYGQIGNTKVKFSYIYTYYETSSTDSQGHTTTQTNTIFSGLFFKADFNKNFLGEVYVFPHSFRLFSPKAHTTKVEMEDAEFNSIFDVFGTDPVITMYVLSTSLVKRLLDFKKKINSHIGAIALILIIIVALYNNLVSNKNATIYAYASIDALLKKRFDLIPNLVNVAKEYMDYEKNVLDRLTQLRTQL